MASLLSREEFLDRFQSQMSQSLLWISELGHN